MQTAYAARITGIFVNILANQQIITIFVPNYLKLTSKYLTL